ncbi:phage major capsid protein [Azospirillum soli]|uniref:phage major capsid protein n=1 Tax=Azospirillum soli TaxID=1304799 RepID=UPI001AE10854|nr:phage major capsid protein [Azospirillum soli]MBP2315986.1 HK97 family phage major capsid protein [Azospirillum soli]
MTAVGAALALGQIDPRCGWETREEQGTGNDTMASGGADEIRAALDEFTGAATQRLDGTEAGVTELRTRMDAIERALRRPGAGGGGTEQRGNNGPAPETRAFEAFVRRGREQMTAEETRSLRVSDDTNGGVLAPAEFIPELQRNVVLFSPVRAVANVRGIGAGTAILPKRTGGMTATWTGDTEDRQETTVSFGAAEYPVAEITAYVDVPNALLEDSAFDINALLAFEFGEEFGAKEGGAFVIGNGVKKPMGFMNDKAILTTRSGHASQITADGLIDLFYALPSPYRANAVWHMNSTTTAAVRKLKTATGEYLWSDGFKADTPPTILGRPVCECPDMPSIAAGACPIAFGDFMQGYRIFDRVPLSLLRDPFTVAHKGMTRFHGRRRVAGGVGKAEAIRKLVIQAAE